MLTPMRLRGEDEIYTDLSDANARRRESSISKSS